MWRGGGGHGPRLSYRRAWKLGMRMLQLAFFVNDVTYGMQRFVKKVSQRVMSYTLLSHHLVSSHTPFVVGSHKKVWSVFGIERVGPRILWLESESNVQSSCKFPRGEPDASSNYETTEKTMNADLTTNYDAETNTL